MAARDRRTYRYGQGDAKAKAETDLEERAESARPHWRAQIEGKCGNRGDTTEPGTKESATDRHG